MYQCRAYLENGARCPYIAKNGQAMAAHLKRHQKGRLRLVEERLAVVETKIGIKQAAPVPSPSDDVEIEED